MGSRKRDGGQNGRGDENREDGGGERDPGKLRIVMRGGSENAIEGATPTSSQ